MLQGMVTLTRKTIPQLYERVLVAPVNRFLSGLEAQASSKGMSAVSDQHNGHTDRDNVIQLLSSNLKQLATQGASVLKSGKVIAVPTDTVYGIAADAQNNDAIERIYKIKGRDFRKPIAICVSSIDQVYLWGKVTVSRSLLEDLLPGPVTLVFERQCNLNPNLNPTTNLIGIRIPDYQFIVDLAKFHDGPIALTSANLSASPSTLEVEEFTNLWPYLDCVFNGGRLSTCAQTEQAARAGSTVIDLSGEGSYDIIRKGTAHERCVQILQEKHNLKRHQN